MTFSKRQKDKERNYTSNSQRFEVEEEIDYMGAKGTFGTREVFSILIVLAIIQLRAFVKTQTVH